MVERNLRNVSASYIPEYLEYCGLLRRMDEIQRERALRVLRVTLRFHDLFHPAKADDAKKDPDIQYLIEKYGAEYKLQPYNLWDDRTG